MTTTEAPTSSTSNRPGPTPASTPTSDPGPATNIPNQAPQTGPTPATNAQPATPTQQPARPATSTPQPRTDTPQRANPTQTPAQPTRQTPTQTPTRPPTQTPTPNNPAPNPAPTPAHTPTGVPNQATPANPTNAVPPGVYADPTPHPNGKPNTQQPGPTPDHGAPTTPPPDSAPPTPPPLSQGQSLQQIRDSLNHAPYGLLPPDPAHQQALADAVPRNPDGTPQRHPDPHGNWAQLQNDGGLQQPGRSNNCLDNARAGLSTWFGDPQVSAPRTPDTNADGTLDRMSPERDSYNNLDAWAGRPQIWAGADHPNPYARIADHLQQAGPGSAAVVGVQWPGGGGHAFNVYNHNGNIVWVDHQTGEVSDSPIHTGAAGVRYVPFDSNGQTMDAPWEKKADTDNQQSQQNAQTDQNSQADQNSQNSQADQNTQSDQSPQSDESAQNPQSNQSNQSNQSDQPTQSPQSTQPDQSPQSNQPTQADQPNQSPQSDPSTQPGQSHQPDQSTQPTQSDPSTQPGQPTQSNPSPQPDQPTQPTPTTPDPTPQNTTPTTPTTLGYGATPEPDAGNGPTPHPDDSQPRVRRDHAGDRLLGLSPQEAQQINDQRRQRYDAQRAKLQERVQKAELTEQRAKERAEKAEKKGNTAQATKARATELKHRNIAEALRGRIQGLDPNTLRNDEVAGLPPDAAQDRLRDSHAVYQIEHGTVDQQLRDWANPQHPAAQHGISPLAQVLRTATGQNQHADAAPHKPKTFTKAGLERALPGFADLNRGEQMHVITTLARLSQGVHHEYGVRNQPGQSGNTAVGGHKARNERVPKNVTDNVAAQGLTGVGHTPDFGGVNYAVIEVERNGVVEYVVDSSVPKGPDISDKPKHSEDHLLDWMDEKNAEQTAAGQPGYRISGLYTEREPCGEDRGGRSSSNCSDQLSNRLDDDVPVYYSTAYRAHPERAAAREAYRQANRDQYKLSQGLQPGDAMTDAQRREFDRMVMAAVPDARQETELEADFDRHIKSKTSQLWNDLAGQLR